MGRDAYLRSTQRQMRLDRPEPFDQFFRHRESDFHAETPRKASPGRTWRSYVFILPSAVVKRNPTRR